MKKHAQGKLPTRTQRDSTYEALFYGDAEPFRLNRIHMDVTHFSRERRLIEIFLAGKLEDLRAAGLLSAIQKWLTELKTIGIAEDGESGKPSVRDYRDDGKNPETLWLLLLRPARPPSDIEVVTTLHQLGKMLGRDKIDELKVSRRFTVRVQSAAGIKLVKEGEYLLQQI